MQHERVGVPAQLRDNERDTLGHQASDESNIPRQPVQLGYQDAALGGFGRGEGGGKLRAALWEKRAPSPELRQLWLRRVQWPSTAQANAWWNEAGGDLADGPAFAPRAGGQQAQIDHIIDTIHFVASHHNGAIQVADCASFLAARVRKIQSGLVRQGAAAEAIEGLWERRLEPFVYADEVWAPVWG